MNKKECKKCVYYGGKRKRKIICLNGRCIKDTENRKAKKGAYYGS